MNFLQFRVFEKLTFENNIIVLEVELTTHP